MTFHLETEKTIYVHLLERFKSLEKKQVSQNSDEAVQSISDEKSLESLKSILVFILKRSAQQMWPILQSLETIGLIQNNIVAHPWDFPEKVLFHIIRDSKTQHNIFIVGAHHGGELRTLAQLGNIQSISLFEPVPENIYQLKSNASLVPFNTCVIQAAVGASCEEVIFYDSTNAGNGSVLSPTEYTKMEWGTEIKSTFVVPQITLNEYCTKTGLVPSILWIDVQGAEMNVLRGASTPIMNCQFIFIEISLWQETYDGGCIIDSINAYLASYGFKCTQMGTDIKTGTGNALYERRLG
jgi:FkbM family methyltransferase